MTNEWDNTPWAGLEVKAISIVPYQPRQTAVVLGPNGLPNLASAGFGKATLGGSVLSTYQKDVPLSLFNPDPRQQAAMYLRAYGVGWFNKAGRKISGDVAGLTPTLAYEDAEGDNAEEIVAPANNVPFERLDPLEQFLRLMERPNPNQTGKQLRQKTQIHLDFAGRTVWYMEGAPGLPTALYQISATRMEPSVDKAGNLIGWVMDRSEGNPGIPFSTDEILPFVNAGYADDPWTGSMGVVQAVYAQVPLTDLMARHTADVLSTGGRLAGMLWPKDRALTEDEFTDAQRAWRNVASDPNAARRLLIFPEPMEYAVGAASPQQLGLTELADLSRDQILTAFPISPHMLQIPLASGLNSGESLRYIRQEYWEGTIHDRGEVMEEVIQTGMIPLYEAAVGRPLDFDLEEPNLDTADSLLQKAAAVEALQSLGFDDKEAIAAAGLDHIKWIGRPTPEPTPTLPGQPAPGPQPPQAQVAANDRGSSVGTTENPVSKAVKARRADVIGKELPGFQTEMQAFLDDQRARVTEDVTRVVGPLTKAARKALPDSWWDREREDRLLREALRGLYVRLSRSALQVVSNEVDQFVLKERINRITAKMLESAGQRITGINETTRAAVQQAIEEGVRRGYSIGQITNGVTDEAYAGLKGLPAFDEPRAELVARTETMLGYNQSALLGYQEYDVAEVEAIDGDDDPECAERDGQTFSIDDALAIEDHPNGTLDWLPLSA